VVQRAPLGHAGLAKQRRVGTRDFHRGGGTRQRQLLARARETQVDRSHKQVADRDVALHGRATNV